MLERLARGKLGPEQADKLLAAARWIGKTPKHAARAFLHLASRLPDDDDNGDDNGDDNDGDNEG